MENLKIRVNGADESKEAQELLFKLGGSWAGYKEIETWVDIGHLYLENDCISFGSDAKYFEKCKESKEITLPELREMAHQDQDEPFLTPECTLNDQYAEIEQVRQHSHYFKDVSSLNEIDVYMVLKLFNVTDPCLQHIAKKALCAGQRGHKNFNRDLKDILDTAKRAVEINK